MAVGAAVWGGIVLLICIGLFVAGVRMDESSVRPALPRGAADTAPMRRSLAALVYENNKLRQLINTTVEENKALRARLRAGLPKGTMLEADSPTPTVPEKTALGGSVEATGRGTRPRPLAEYLRMSTEFNKERAQAVATNNQIILTFVKLLQSCVPMSGGSVNAVSVT